MDTGPEKNTDIHGRENELGGESDISKHGGACRGWTYNERPGDTSEYHHCNLQHHFTVRIADNNSYFRILK